MTATTLHAPTTEAEAAIPASLTDEQRQAQAVLDAGDYATMIRESIQTLRSELYAAEFMAAELAQARDVQNRKKKFLRAAGKLTGLLPEFTECALRMIQGQGK